MDREVCSYSYGAFLYRGSSRSFNVVEPLETSLPRVIGKMFCPSHFFLYSQLVWHRFSPLNFHFSAKLFPVFFLLALFRLPLSNIQQRLMHPLSLASFSEWNGLASAKAKAS